MSLLNGVSYGLLLFMLSAGLTLIFSMMGVLNFAHASFYMLGAYFAYQVSSWSNFWVGLLIAPIIVALLGGLFERYLLRKTHKFGHVPELLVTFGLSFVILELVQLIWGAHQCRLSDPAVHERPAIQGVRFDVSDLPRLHDACCDTHAFCALLGD